MAAMRHLGFFRNLNFKLSIKFSKYHISHQSVKPLLRYVYSSIFQDGDRS